MSMLCPIIGLALIAVAAWLAVSGLKLRALARDPLPACSHCGHLIEGSRLLCTECGTQWTQEHLSRLALARRNSGTKRLVIALSCFGLCLLLAIAAVLTAMSMSFAP